MTLGAQTVVILRPAPPDRFGDRPPGFTETAVSGCSVQPVTTTELRDGRDTVVTGMRAFLPAGVDLLATDLIRVGEQVFSVDGTPERWVDLDGIEDHIEVALRRVEG